MKPSQAQPLPALMLSALGVVFGDIGTSPLYAFKEAFSPDGGLTPSPATVFPVLSMMFWAVTIVVSLKYVLIMLRFDHRGEGGVLALLARALTSVGERPRLAWIVAALGVFAASLFYGDAIITVSGRGDHPCGAPAAPSGRAIGHLDSVRTVHLAAPRNSPGW
jgi:KUP system potassium uptake protein